MSKHALLIETQKWNAYQTKSKPGLLVYNPAGHGMQTEDDTAPVAKPVLQARLRAKPDRVAKVPGGVQAKEQSASVLMRYSMKKLCKCAISPPNPPPSTQFKSCCDPLHDSFAISICLLTYFIDSI